MEKIIRKCHKCGSEKWISQKRFPSIRKCANEKCDVLHPDDIIKLENIKGLLYDMDKKEFIDPEELIEGVK